MSILDSYMGFARETTYGTFVSPARSFEAETDGPKLELQHLEIRGMRASTHGLRKDRVKTIKLGAGGPLPLTVLSKGFGMLFRAMMGNSTGPTQQAATTAWLQEHDSDSDGPKEKLSGQYVRVRKDGTTEPWTYLGVTIPEWELSQKIDDWLKLMLTLDAREESHDAATYAAHAATYPASTKGFTWDDFTLTIDGAAVDVQEFSLKANNGLNVDKARRMKSTSPLKNEPQRVRWPAYTGAVLLDYENETYYDLVAAGTDKQVVATWTGDVIEGAHNFSIVLTLPSVQFRGETPETDVEGDVPRQPLPFTVLYDGANPMVSLDYKSTDTAF